MLPGKDGQSPYVTCGAKVRTSLVRSLVCSPVRACVVVPSTHLVLHLHGSAHLSACPLVCLMPHLSLRYRSDKEFLGKDSRKRRVAGWRAVTLTFLKENTPTDEKVRSWARIGQHFCIQKSVCSLCLQKEDSAKMGPLKYFPPNGTFNLMYYPYYGKKAQVTLSLTHTHTRQCRSFCDTACHVFPVSGELHSASGGREVHERLVELRHQRGV